LGNLCELVSELKGLIGPRMLAIMLGECMSFRQSFSVPVLATWIVQPIYYCKEIQMQ